MATRICYKCKKDNATIKMRENLSCKDCYFYLIEHLFKIGFSKGKSKLDKNILVAYSGGSSSLLILNLLRQCITGTGRSRMDLRVEVIHIETPFTTPYIDQIKENCEKYEFPLTILPLSFSEEEINNINRNTNIDQKYVLYQSDLCNIINQYASNNNYEVVLYGYNMTHLGNLIFNSVLQGRGYNLPYITNPINTINNDKSKIKIIYPLSNIMIKEIVLYNYYHQINSIPEFIFTSSFSSSSSSASPISSKEYSTITSNFLSSLNHSFPSTLHTLNQTVQKLEIPIQQSDIESGKVIPFLCPVCNQFLTPPIIERIKIKEMSEIKLIDVICNGCFNQYFPGKRENSDSIDNNVIQHLQTKSIMERMNKVVELIKK